MHEVAILLHNIRSAHNVGSIFRTADAVGVSKVYVSGYSPAPIDRFGRPVKEIQKTALDAQDFLPWEQVSDPYELIERLKSEGWVVIGVEQDARAERYDRWKAKEKTLIVMGTEVGGMTQETRDACDVLLEIPMRGKKDSLNVSVAAGVVLYEILKENVNTR